jgi:hypothetical protein
MRAPYGSIVIEPGRETAPGPGKSAFASIVVSNIGGMQKTLTSRALCVPEAMQVLGGGG